MKIYSRIHPQKSANGGRGLAAALCLGLLLTAGPARAADGANAASGPLKLTAHTYNSGFPQAHDTYNGMCCASDGRIYYVLCSEAFDVGAQMYCFDPKTRTIRHLGDLTEACGEKDSKTIVQGKSHVNFVESNGKLYFGTHAGYYKIVDGMEKMGDPPPGYKPYPGGHLLSYDMKTGTFEELGRVPDHEACLSFNMDPHRSRMFGLTWPSGSFFRFNLATREFKNFGKVCGDGEAGQGAAYRTICRSISVDPATGRAWFTTGEGAIMAYNPESDTLETVQGENLKKDYFGVYDPTDPGNMAYNWRQSVWNPADKMVYAVHGNSGYLLRFDPGASRVEVLDRITSEPSKRCGMFDQYSYGYLGFTLGPDGHTLYYLTGAPIYVDGKRVTGKSKIAMGAPKGLEDLHLVTYDIPQSKYTDHGAIFYENGERPTFVNSIAIGKDGAVYFIARVNENGLSRGDLVSVPSPFK